MEKNNIELIKKYVNGEDLGSYTEEELENDRNFMMQVIFYTNDFKMYNRCSNELKSDYEFVKSIINKFSSNIWFVCSIADEFLSNADDDLERAELCIIMSNITKGKVEKKYNEYITMADAIFLLKRLQIEMAKIDLNSEYASKEIGMGFLVIFDSFNSSKIVLDYYAKKLIDAIFSENDIDLENVLHEQFENPEQINKEGIDMFMLRFIRFYDSMLSSYLSTNNMQLMEDLKNRIIKIQNNWNNYNQRDERSIYNLMFMKVHEYMEEHIDDCTLDETTMLYYAAKKLGIAHKVAQYDYLSLYVYDEIGGFEVDDEFVNDTLEVSFSDRIHLNNIKKIMSEIIFSKEHKVSEINSDCQSSGDIKTKVIKLDFKNKKLK